MYKKTEDFFGFFYAFNRMYDILPDATIQGLQSFFQIVNKFDINRCLVYSFFVLCV